LSLSSFLCLLPSLLCVILLLLHSHFAPCSLSSSSYSFLFSVLFPSSSLYPTSYFSVLSLLLL
jgi:hypothetical protein